MYQKVTRLPTELPGKKRKEKEKKKKRKKEKEEKKKHLTVFKEKSERT